MAADDSDTERPPPGSDGEAASSAAASGDRAAVSGDGTAESGDRAAASGDGTAASGDRAAVSGDGTAASGDRAAPDLARGDRAVVVTQTSLYDTTFGAPCGGTDKVDELAGDRVVSVTAACEDANGDGWVEVAAEGGGPLGWVDAADLQPVTA